jgi:hypothetical protein
MYASGSATTYADARRTLNKFHTLAKTARLTEDEAERLTAAIDTRDAGAVCCGICGAVPTSPFVVQHDAETGTVRCTSVELVCEECANEYYGQQDDGVDRCPFRCGMNHCIPTAGWTADRHAMFAVNRMKVACPLKHDDGTACGFEGNISAIGKHLLEECALRRAAGCPNEYMGCTALDALRDANKLTVVEARRHFEHECEYRVVPCPVATCTKRVRCCDMDEHMFGPDTPHKNAGMYLLNEASKRQAERESVVGRELKRLKTMVQSQAAALASLLTSAAGADTRDDDDGDGDGLSMVEQLRARAPPPRPAHAGQVQPPRPGRADAFGDRQAGQNAPGAAAALTEARLWAQHDREGGMSFNTLDAVCPQTAPRSGSRSAEVAAYGRRTGPPNTVNTLNLTLRLQHHPGSESTLDWRRREMQKMGISLDAVDGEAVWRAVMKGERVPPNPAGWIGESRKQKAALARHVTAQAAAAGGDGDDE